MAEEVSAEEVSDAEYLAAIRAKHGVGMSGADEARLLAQGVALGFGDEIEAAVRALSPTVTYAEALKEIRESISKAKESYPLKSAALEVGGALVPGLAAAPFTGGTSLIPSIGRAAAIGAAEGAIYGLGTGEGAEGRIKEGVKGAVTGAILNPAVQKGMQSVTGGATGLSNYLRGKFGNKLAKPVQDEVMRIVEGSGLSVDEIIMRIDNGEIFPDMSESALTELRGYAAQGGKGQEIIDEALRRRSSTLKTDVIETLQRDLATDTPTGNITMAFNKNIKELKAAESKAYDELFKDAEVNLPIGPNSAPALNAVVGDLLQDFTFLRPKVNQILTANKLPPIFKVGKDKKLTLTRALDLETVEQIRRALSNRVDKGFKSSDSALAIPQKARLTELTQLLDEISEPLKQTRAKWSSIMDAQEMFEKGKSALNMKPEELEELVFDMSADNLTALRTGFTTMLKFKAGANARQTLINKLDKLDGNERIVLETLYPDEAFDSIADKILKSRQAFTTEGQTLRGSMTPFTQQAVKRQGSGANLSDLADVLTSTTIGNVSGAAYSSARIVKRTLGKEAAALNEDQIAEISRILVTESPSVFSNAVKNVEGREKLIAIILKITRSVAGGLGTSAIVAGDEIVGDTIANMFSPASASASEMPQPTQREIDLYNSVNLPSAFGTDNPLLYDQETGERYGGDSPALDSLVSTIKPNASKKIRQSAQ